MIKGLKAPHASPERSTLKKVGNMLDVAIPGTLDLMCDLDVSLSYQRYYNMLSEKDRNRVIAQQQAYLKEMRSKYNGEAEGTA